MANVWIVTAWDRELGYSEPNVEVVGVYSTEELASAATEFASKERSVTVEISGPHEVDRGVDR